jgi:L-ascorbate metabolism protein UlaG (beta-lactamase superfamily)
VHRGAAEHRRVEVSPPEIGGVREPAAREHHSARCSDVAELAVDLHPHTDYLTIVHDHRDHAMPIAERDASGAQLVTEAMGLAHPAYRFTTIG